jgi:hypothetical protein
MIVAKEKKTKDRLYALDAVDQALKKIGKRSQGGVPELRGDEVASAVAEAFFRSEEASRALRLMKGAFETVAASVANEKHDLPMEVLAAYKKLKGKGGPDLALLYILAQAAPGEWEG